MVRPGGILIYDTNGITRHPVREDIEVYAIDATAECARMGQAKLFNTMILGGYLKVSTGFPTEVPFMAIRQRSVR